MLEKAINKIRSEMDQNSNNPYIQVVGAFLLQHLNSNPEAAEKFLTPDKTIAKSLDEMRKVAEKKKIGNCAVLTDQEGFEVVIKYFGVNATFEPVSAKKDSVITDFDIKLEDLL